MDNYEMREALERAKQKILEQDEMLRELTSAPFALGTVLKSGTRYRDHVMCIVSYENKQFEVVAPSKLTSKLRIGATVRMNPQALSIIDVLDTPAISGDLARVVKVSLDGTAEVEIGGDVRLVSFHGPLDRGDRVAIDETKTVILRNLGKDEQRFSFELTTNTRWDDIGGQEQAKLHLREAIELPYTHPELFESYGKKPIKGVLLYGPPGCGKTMLAKATATSLAATHGHIGSSGFMYVKGPEVLDKFVGNSEATIRALFARAREHHKKHGYPAVLFIDEADALLSVRGQDRTSNMEKTIVPMFLAEMDGLEESNAMVILATNRADQLDPAIVRDGRIDRKVEVQRPAEADAQAIFEMYFKSKPFAEGLGAKTAAKLATTELFSQKRVLYDLALVNGERKQFRLHHLVSGAMVHGMVETATSIAMRRDIEKRARKNGGLTEVDIKAAADNTFTQIKGLNHFEELRDFAEKLGDAKVLDVRKAA